MSKLKGSYFAAASRTGIQSSAEGGQV